MSIFKREKKKHTFLGTLAMHNAGAVRGIPANFIFLSSSGGPAFYLSPSWRWGSVAHHWEDVLIFINLICCVEHVCIKMLISKGFLSTLSLLQYLIVKKKKAKPNENYFFLCLSEGGSYQYVTAIYFFYLFLGSNLFLTPLMKRM